MISKTISSGLYTKVDLGIKKVKGRIRPVVRKTATARGAAMVENEARILAKLHHDGVANIMDFDRKTGQPRITLKYIEGVPLASWIAYPKFASIKDDLALTIGIEIAKILAYLHQNHQFDNEVGMVVHGDLNPANILIGLDGKVHLIDFGNAQIERRDGKSILPAKTATIPYASPDRVTFERVSVRDDIFALGIILWELATGRRYWGESSPSEILTQLRDFHFKDPSPARPDIPRLIRSVIIQCLDSEGFAGYQESTDIVRDLVSAQTQHGLEPVNLGNLCPHFPRIIETLRLRRDLFEKLAERVS